MRRLALTMLVVCALAAPAAAKKRVALLPIEGKGGEVVRDAVNEVLQRDATVVSENAFRRRQAKLGIVTLTDEAYARVAAELAADAIVSGTWRSAGKRWRLSLAVREGRTGELVNEVVVFIPGGKIDQAAKDAIAADLLPAVSATSPMVAPVGEGDGSPDATAPPSDVVAAPPSGDVTATAPPPAPAPPTPTPEEPSDSPSASVAEGGLGPISGKTFAYVRAPVDGGPFQQISASLWLRARPRLTDATSATIEVALDGFEVSQIQSSNLRLSLREAYVTLKEAGWLVRVGHQIIPWGSSDVVNPTDFLTARDFRFFVTDTELARLGALSVLASKAWPSVEMTVVATPLHPVSRLLIPDGVIPAGVTLGEAAPRGPAVEDTEVAAKLKVSGRGWDLALVGFRGFNHTPELELVSADQTGTVVRQTNHEVIAGGIDGSASLGKLIVRVEGAYVKTENPDGTDPTIQPSYLFGVLGLERPLGDRLRVQAQFIARDYPKWAAPDTAEGPDPATAAAEQGIAAANALLLDYQDAFRPAATLRLAFATEDERIEAEVFAAMNFVGGDYLVRPLVGWHPTDAVTVQVGLEAYGGPEDRPLGALQPFGGAFGQVTYAF